MNPLEQVSFLERYRKRDYFHLIDRNDVLISFIEEKFALIRDRNCLELKSEAAFIFK